MKDGGLATDRLSDADLGRFDELVQGFYILASLEDFDETCKTIRELLFPETIDPVAVKRMELPERDGREGSEEGEIRS